MEEFDQGWGSIIYSTTLPELKGQSKLTIKEGHDYLQVFIDGKYIGALDRRMGEKELLLPSCRKGARMDILVEAMGRINFGRAIKDFKGINSDVTLTTQIEGIDFSGNIKKWDNYLIPDSYDEYLKKNYKPLTNTKVRDDKGQRVPGFYKATFDVKKPGDTFLNFEHFGKGLVYVNGYGLGRIWEVGPQQTLYVPACWMKRGLNEVVVLDVVGPAKTTLWAQDKPELDQLNLEKSVTHNNPGDKPDLNSATPVAAGSFAPGNGWQTVRFAAPAKGRYIALQALSTHEGKDNVCVAEVYALGKDGKRISREPWTVKYADSEEIIRGNNLADKVFDLQESTYWRTAKGATLPHLMVVDLGSVQQLSGFEYLPRAEEGAPGSIKDYRIFVYL
jgi:beta-galactosidase